jgi:hypothetical protein
LGFQTNRAALLVRPAGGIVENRGQNGRAIPCLP